MWDYREICRHSKGQLWGALDKGNETFHGGNERKWGIAPMIGSNVISWYNWAWSQTIKRGENLENTQLKKNEKNGISQPQSETNWGRKRILANWANNLLPPETQSSLEWKCLSCHGLFSCVSVELVCGQLGLPIGHLLHSALSSMFSHWKGS